MYVVKFLEQHALKNPEKKWWWLYQASYIANYEIRNMDLAIELATKLKNVALAQTYFAVKTRQQEYIGGAELGINIFRMTQIEELTRKNKYGKRCLCCQ